MKKGKGREQVRKEEGKDGKEGKEGRREGGKEGRKEGRKERRLATLIGRNSRNGYEVGLNRAIGVFENWWEVLFVIGILWLEVRMNNF